MIRNDTQDRLIRTARSVVRSVQWANRGFLLGVGAALLASWLLPAPFATLVANWLPGADAATASAALRATLLLGLAMALVTDRLLTTLAAIVASAHDPFIAINARRLQAIGWWLLALQAFALPGALIRSSFPVLGDAGPSGEVSIAGWLSVLMVFVLARVFATGTAMRDDLAGTI